MSKWLKGLLGIAAIGGAAACLVYFLKKSDSDMEDVFEDEDFDLDNDLKPASDREYVSLNAQPKAEEDTEETVEEIVKETVEEEASVTE